MADEDKHECPICGRMILGDVGYFQNHAERCLDSTAAIAPVASAAPVAGPSRQRSPSLEIIGGPYGDGDPVTRCPSCATSWHLLGLAGDADMQNGHVEACLIDQMDSQTGSGSKKRSWNEANGADFERFDVETDGCPCCGRAWTRDEPPDGPMRTAHVEACLTATTAELDESGTVDEYESLGDFTLPMSDEVVRGKASA